MVYVLVILAGFAFGALDQYLGTVHVTQHVGWWTITVSGMSAPWLIVPFLAGMTQDRPRKAAGLGLLVTMSALLGYFWMSNSAFEGVALDRTLPRMEAMIRSDTNLLWIAGGLITGPLVRIPGSPLARGAFLGCGGGGRVRALPRAVRARLDRNDGHRRPQRIEGRVERRGGNRRDRRGGLRVDDRRRASGTRSPVLTGRSTASRRGGASAPRSGGPASESPPRSRGTGEAGREFGPQPPRRSDRAGLVPVQSD